MQATLARSTRFTGVGLHGGHPVTMTIRPAAADTGIRFRRIDVTDRAQVVLARFDRVVDTRLCTMLGNEDGVTVSTVEHVMAALAALSVDNALIDIDGPEVPIVDGSARPFIDAIARTGLAFSPEPRKVFEIRRRVVVSRDDAIAEIRPAKVFSIDYAIDFPDAAIGRQRLAMTASPANVVDELANCRTFARLHEIEALRRAGLARGGDLSNAVVVDGDRVLNPGGLRRPDEFVRHKMLDAVGDMALAGGAVVGALTVERGGHEMTNRLLRAVFADKSAYRWVARDDHPALATTAAATVSRMAAE
jgi:UDP-3-O-[3-hydroxymyristoyl] N-acetylglucosamine deacetylase